MCGGFYKASNRDIPYLRPVIGLRERVVWRTPELELKEEHNDGTYFSAPQFTTLLAIHINALLPGR